MTDRTWAGQDSGPVKFAYQRIELPNGLSIFYDKLDRSSEGEWSYFYGREQKWLFGGKMLENIVQALARSSSWTRRPNLKRALARLGDQLALQVHDELVYVVPRTW